MNDENLFQKVPRLYKEITKKEHAELKDNLGWPVGIGIIFAIIFGAAAWYGVESVNGVMPNRLIFSVIVAIFSAVIVAVATFMGIEWSKSKRERKTEGEIVKEAILKAVARIEAKEPYSDLMDLQLSLPWPFMEIFTQIMKDSIKSGGAVVVSSGSEKYLKYLEQFLEVAQKKFQATLRGGKTEPKYKLSWFNKGDTRGETPPAGVTKKQKLEWLDLVDNSEIAEKIRILIFDKNNPEEFRDFLNPEIRNNYFEHNKKVNCYLISPAELLDLLKMKEIDEQKAQFIFEDYAIFDEEVVLKHNGINALSVSVKSQTDWHKAVFEILKQYPDRFLEVNETHIGKKTWEEFEENLS